MGKCLIGIHMIVIRIAARPVKLEASQGFEVFRILGNHRFQKEAVAEAFGKLGINHQLIHDLVRRKINEQGRFVRIGQMGLEDGIGQKIPVGS